MSKKTTVRHIEQPKTMTKAERLRFQAELRGGIMEAPKVFNRKKFLLISLLVLKKYFEITNGRYK